jgi:hypothetical protein
MFREARKERSMNIRTLNLAVVMALSLGSALSVVYTISAARARAPATSTIQLGNIRVTPADAGDLTASAGVEGTLYLGTVRVTPAPGQGIRYADTAPQAPATAYLGSIRVTPAADERYAANLPQPGSTLYLGVVHVKHSKAQTAAGSLMAERHTAVQSALQLVGALVFGRAGG